MAAGAPRRVLRYTGARDRGGAFVVTEEPPRTVEADQVLVRCVCAVVDLEPLWITRVPGVPVASFLGRVVESASPDGPDPGALVVGTGPLGEVVAVRRESVWTVAGEMPPEHLALLPQAAAVLKAVGEAGIRMGDRVVISGGGVAAGLAMEVARLYAGRWPETMPAASSRHSTPGSPDAGACDVLIDTTADAAAWAWRLGLLRVQGVALLLLPPGVWVHAFDFYPMVHRRSLSLLVRRVPEADGRPAATDAITTAGRLIRQGIPTVGERFYTVRLPGGAAGADVINLTGMGDAAGLLCRFEGPG
ncbi:MAG: hypothetical protein QN168_11315 [Armatimonadota bacterium]|nr:hypothetical protein [Armatimonadota bacterium]